MLAMSNQKLNPNSNQDRDLNQARDPQNIPANDNGGNAVVSKPAGGALASLTALGTALGRVLAVSGHSGTQPMMFFKSREDGGTWVWGPKNTIPEEGSQWAGNPLTFRWGYIAFLDSTTKVGESMVSVTQPLPLVTELPDVGAEWKPQWSVDMKCINGADAGVEVVFKASTVGTIDAVKALIGAVADRINGGQHGGSVAPIVSLGRSSYPHKKYGPISTPVLEIKGWMPLEGPAPATPAPEPESPPSEAQPRRRRAA
jgi:hypothetical protein